ncbi:MAG: hypothetical protein RL219_1972 [Actinomycetota bacterium]|jgi:transcription elongation factor GreA
MGQIHQLTRRTAERLQAELTDLTTRGRIEIAQAIERARELGDLSENGDYHAAKDQQGLMEGRIRQLQSILEDHEVVEQDVIAQHVESGTVYIGTVVKIVYEGDDHDDAETYIVGHVEEKTDEFMVISPTSPIGSAVIGKKVTDWVEYEGPRGKLRVQILHVEPA